nr:hypothetical protein BaRGS_035012 [Batillaria attramentaria]
MVGNMVEISNERFSLLHDGTLMIEDAQDDDQGSYECIARNVAGEVHSNQVELRYFGEPVRPVITHPPADISTVEGNPANFTCDASGDPQPRITWYRQGVEVQTGREFELLSDGHVLVVRQPEPLYEWMRDGRIVQSRNRITVNAGTLTINNVNLQDSGRYDCVAENVVGRAAKSIFLQVQGTSVSRPGDRFVSNAIVEATNRVNSAVNNTLAQLFDRNRHITVSDLIAAFRYPSPAALEPARAEEIFEQTLEIINQKVRDGWNRGKLYNGFHLPSPRLISSLLMATPHITNDDLHTHMLMQWGQFLDHDLDLSPQAISFSRFSDGTRCNETLGGNRLLPFDDSTLAHADCQIEPTKRHVPCFRAGDHRANEQLALTTMHTLWMRTHNQIATTLLQLNNHWDGNKVYHEARKIVGAIMQHITYQHWLPKIIGPKGLAMMGPYQGYNASVNPSIVNEFATAAFRFGHSLVQPVIFRLNESFQELPEGNLPLHRAFFAPYRLLEEGGIDPLLRGLFGAAAKKRMPGEFFNAELTEKLFVMANAIDNIDLFIGGMSETPVEGAKIGPTFICIISGQFQRLRDGDRFYYENPGVFTPEQLIEIKRTSLAQIICQSADNIDRVQPDVFLRVENDEEYLTCNSYPRLDLRMWTDCCEGNVRNKVEKGTEEKVETCSKEDVDLMDTRIEGMEAAMMEMNHLVQLMQKKVWKCKEHP